MTSHGIALSRVNGNLKARFRLLDGSDWAMTDPEPLQDGVWHHVVMTWKEDIGGKLYMNGQLIKKTMSPAQSGAQPAYDTFYIGRSNKVNSHHGRAWYDDIRVYYQYKDATFIDYLIP